jgi:hypothetical protein
MEFTRQTKSTKLGWRLDRSTPIVCVSLRTHDLGEAMVKRDLLEIADDEFWAFFFTTTDIDVSMRQGKHHRLNRTKVFVELYGLTAPLAQ